MPKSTRWHHCTAQAEDGSFCDAPSIDGAPFPICTRHGAQLLRFLQGSIAELQSAPVELRMMVMDQTHDERRRRDHLPINRDEVVYYVQVGGHIKIGVTCNLKNRLAAYPPNRRLLATESGDEHVEAERHRAFAEYRDLGREWFNPGPRLLEHINRLRAKSGAPLIERFV